MSSEIASIVSQQLSSRVEDLTAALQADAKSAKWPDEVIQALSIEVDENGVNVSYPEQLDKQIDDLEYGNSGIPPRPVLRLFADRHSDLFTEAVADGAFDYLFDSEVLP
jgi:hypothetical protein